MTQYDRGSIDRAELAIRRIVRDGYLKGEPKDRIAMKVRAEIESAVRKQIPALRSVTARSLQAFAKRQYATYVRAFGISPVLVAAVAAFLGGKTAVSDKKSAETVLSRYMSNTSADGVSWETRATGVPMQTYAEKIFKERIRPAWEELMRQTPMDSDDLREISKHKNSLRNRVEMELRYDEHLQQIAEFKERGTKLVVSSVHADCSDRCAPYQGKVYSLDGTSGRTEDGKPYEPLEKATDIYYTTKAGKTYKNGLLGFNCRHYLYEYKPGMVIPHVSEAERKRQNRVTQRQRELERNVRLKRTEEEMYAGIDEKRAKKARAERIAAEREYRRFSERNRRAYYPSRTKTER